MSDNFLAKLKNTLNRSIQNFEDIHDLFCLHPGVDFTRNRKIDLRSYVNFMIQMQSKSLPNETMDFFGHSITSPTKSAFVQARDKVTPEGWYFLFRDFHQQCSAFSNNLYREQYRLLACDGSDINIYRNPNDESTFIQEGCGYNAIHLNALYDICSQTYVDYQIQGKKKLHERQALNTMIDRLDHDVPTITIADRGYESFNVFAHFIERKQFFLIRLKDINSNGILSAYDLPNDEFDSYIETTLTKRHTQETMTDVKKYTILPAYTEFDFFKNRYSTYDISFRILRIKVAEDTFVCVATNLPECEFSLDDIRELYRMRWSEETSFRELKYTIGLINWHARKLDAIKQEISARLIMYNFCALVTAHAAVPNNEAEKHRKQINFATTVNICRAYMKNGGDEDELMLLIQKHLTPIRENRKFPITLRPKRNRDFMYRTA